MTVATSSERSSTAKQAVKPALLDSLLHEQRQLSAVEAFSASQDVGLEYEATTEPAQARYYRSLLPVTPPGAGQQYAFEVDLDACSGCKACVVACHTLNGLEEDESWRRVGTLTIADEVPRLHHVTTACHHCSQPGCLLGCPVKAYDKDPVTGIVKHLDDQCIGCKYCTMMCPYEVPVYSQRLGIVRKCDMCQQRLAVAEAPACVQACPNEAIAIRLVTAAEQTFSPEDRLVPGAPLSTITRPTTRYLGLGEGDAERAHPQDAQIDQPAESHWTLVIMLVAMQASIGILGVERLGAWAAAPVFGDPWSSSVTLTATIAAFLVASLGLAVAPLHLGQPGRAWRVFLGLRTSWLSREAVLYGKYWVLLGMAACGLIAERMQTEVAEGLSAWIVNPLLIVALSVGGAGLLSSGMIYVATRRPLWSSRRTMIRFFGSAVVVGTLGVGSILAANQGANSEATTPWLVACLGTGLLAAGTKLAWEWRIQLGRRRLHDSAHDSRSRRLVQGPLAPLRSARLRLGGMTLVVTMLALGAALLPATPHVPLGAILATTFAVAGELVERGLYFSSVVYDRMPGAIE